MESRGLVFMVGLLVCLQGFALAELYMKSQGRTEKPVASAATVQKKKPSRAPASVPLSPEEFPEPLGQGEEMLRHAGYPDFAPSRLRPFYAFGACRTTNGAVHFAGGPGANRAGYADCLEGESNRLYSNQKSLGFGALLGSH